MDRVEITKQRFLARHQLLVDLMAGYWTGSNQYGIVFRNTSPQRFRKSDKRCSTYQNLGQAYEDFRWDSNDFGVNTRKLLDLQVKIRNDIRRKSKGDLLAHLCDVLAWGGVLTTAVTRPLLEKYKKNELLNYFGWIYEQGPFDASSEDLSELKNIPLDAGVLLSNSGLTKIYSVIGSRCVIYDNRVAAAVGKIIVDYLAEKPLVTESSLVMGPEPRDPSTSLHKFPKKRRGYSYPCSCQI